MATPRDALHESKYIYFYNDAECAVWHGGLIVLEYLIGENDKWVVTNFWRYKDKPTIDKIFIDCHKRR